MSTPEEHKGRYFYHFTHVDNIEKIVASEAILSTNIKKLLGITHHNVANAQIQNRRSEMQVPVGPGGVVHDYVPFYFATVNPMLLGLLNRKTIDQTYMCFMAIPIEKLEESQVVFTDASANTIESPHFYESPEDLDKLNWELIDSRKWKDSSDEERHHRMAEVLVYRRVPLDWIDHFVVFDQKGRKKIEQFYQEFDKEVPRITYEKYTGKPFFYQKYFFKDRQWESLITGPLELREKYEQAVEEICQKRKGHVEEARYADISDLLEAIKKDFCVLPELRGIYGLKTDNAVHTETVSDHTCTVVQYISWNRFFKATPQSYKCILWLAAYLHDIGKGPKEKWTDGIQRNYPDHPADAIPMLKRILTEEVRDISAEEIRYLCMLVVYHDLMGDIIGKGRSMEELRALHLNQEELHMLAALSMADICALDNIWSMEIEKKLERLIKDVLEE